VNRSDGGAHAVARRRGRPTPTGTARPALPTKDTATGRAVLMIMVMNRGAPSPPPALHCTSVVPAARWFSMICRRTQRCGPRPEESKKKTATRYTRHCYPRRLHAGLKISECGRMVVLLLFGDCDTRNSCRKPRSGLAPPLTRCGVWIERKPGGDMRAWLLVS
jgi:hypothetical protein